MDQSDPTLSAVEHQISDELFGTVYWELLGYWGHASRFSISIDLYV